MKTIIAMAKVMEKRFANWQGQSFDEATLEPSDLAEAMMEYLTVNAISLNDG